MKRATKLLFALVLVSALESQPLLAAQGIILYEQEPGTNLCHLKFPAIREETLSWDHPVLKDAGTGDIIDYYGRCDYDPLGADAIQTQKLDLARKYRTSD